MGIGGGRRKGLRDGDRGGYKAGSVKFSRSV